jgi:GntR family transcriptional regulator
VRSIDSIAASSRDHDEHAVTGQESLAVEHHLTFGRAFGPPERMAVEYLHADDAVVEAGEAHGKDLPSRLQLHSVLADPNRPELLAAEARPEPQRGSGGRGDPARAAPGDHLPPARDLAAELGVNTNTVLRALRLLRDEGLLDFRRGRGVHVSGTPDQSALIDRARELVEFARHQGYRRKDLVDLIESLP